jgi:excisionase family DNA binding protein
MTPRYPTPPTLGETDMDKLLLTPEEAAQVLSVGRSKVYELIGGGQLQSVRIGGSRRIPVTAIETFVSGLASSELDTAC